MGFTNLQKIKCDWRLCTNEITHETPNPKLPGFNEIIQKLHEENPWLKTQRLVQTNDSRQFIYCCDEHEILAVGEGIHNPVTAPEPPKIISSNVNPAQVRQAAIEAAREKAATTAMKQGSGLTLV